MTDLERLQQMALPFADLDGHQLHGRHPGESRGRIAGS